MATNQTPNAGPATMDEIVESTRNLIEAARIVVKRWESGDLAEAVTNLNMVADFTEFTLESVADVTPELLEACIQARAALPDAWFAVSCGAPVEVINLLNNTINKAQSCGIEPKVTPKPTTSWAYNRRGRQTFFLWEGWQEQVTNEDTTRGYIEWVENRLDELLHETDLGGVDAIVVAGCTEPDGIVDVSGEQKAELCSVYSHTLDTGYKCICDFNNKAQAIMFATALAARTKIPVYGNQCSIEGGTA